MVLVLVVGAILAPGKRTVSAMRAGDGLALVSRISRTTTPVLSRAVWSSRKASQILLRHLIAVFTPTGVLVMG